MIDRFKACFLFLSCIFFGVTVQANDSGQIERLKRQAAFANLAQAEYWKKLVHYKPSGLTADQWRSDVITPGFFLSASGSEDPRAELEATIEAYLADDSYADDSVRCRYVARYKWLTQEIDLPAYAPERCVKYQSWNQQGRIESLSMIFATGYLDNPASYYGHILLKFNSRDTATQTDLLNYSLNFGAIVPDNEHPLAYMLYGLFGGYDAVFSHQKFYRHHHSYGEVELRDLWEYELRLNVEEVARIVDHSWELMGSAFAYRFMDDNCAYRMSELLTLVTDDPLIPDQSPWSLPYSVFDGLAQSQIRGAPLVRQIKRLPSKQARFQERFEALPATLQAQLSALVDERIALSDPVLTALPLDDQIRLIEVLLAYYNFRLVSEQDETLKQQHRQVMLARIRLPSKQIHWPERGVSRPPHEGQKPSMLRISASHNSQQGEGVQLSFRPAYYDHLSLDAGRLPYSRLSMLETEVMIRNGEVSLRKLDLVNIETLNLSRTGLPGDGGMAWKLRFGIDNPDLSCDRCNVFSVNGGIGRAAEISDALVAFAMLEGRLQSRDDFDRTVAVGGRFGVITREYGNWKGMANLGYQRYLDGSLSEEPFAELSARYGASRDWDIRLSYRKHLATEVNATFSYYW